MSNPLDTRNPRNMHPIMAVPAPLLGNRCPRCEAKLFSTWYADMSCYTCGYEVPSAAPPPVPTPEYLRTLVRVKYVRPEALGQSQQEAREDRRQGAFNRAMDDEQEVRDLMDRGMSRKAIGRYLGVCTSTVTNRLQRAERLRGLTD